MSEGLALDGVRKAFDGAVALDGLSLAVPEGALLTLVGPSGSGKSTALRVVAGLEAPDSGAVRIGGRDVTAAPPARRGVAMVFQGFALFPHLTVAENIGFGLHARGERGPALDGRVAEAAAWLDLDDKLRRRPGELSGGERQRVALARALLARPQVLLLDEPLSNLDAPLREQARTEIRRVHAELGATLVHVTHDQAEALSLGTLTAVVQDGRLAQAGPPQEVYGRPATLFVARFVGTPPMNLARVRLEDGVLRGEGVALPAPPGARLPAGELWAGFRAEDATVTSAGEGFPAVLEVEETFGHERLWRLRTGDRLVAVRPAPADRAAPGTALRVAVAPHAVHLFDAGTGRAL